MLMAFPRPKEAGPWGGESNCFDSVPMSCRSSGASAASDRDMLVARMAAEEALRMSYLSGSPVDPVLDAYAAQAAAAAAAAAVRAVKSGAAGRGLAGASCASSETSSVVSPPERCSSPTSSAGSDERLAPGPAGAAREAAVVSPTAGVDPLGPSPTNKHAELYKTEMCRSWNESGTCRYGMKCQFAHGADELRPVQRHPRYKSQHCISFHTIGTCAYGKRCRFSHEPGPAAAAAVAAAAAAAAAGSAPDAAKGPSPPISPTALPAVPAAPAPHPRRLPPWHRPRSRPRPWERQAREVQQLQAQQAAYEQAMARAHRHILIHQQAIASGQPLDPAQHAAAAAALAAAAKAAAAAAAAAAANAGVPGLSPRSTGEGPGEAGPGGERSPGSGSEDEDGSGRRLPIFARLEQLSVRP
eukprot:tig00000507_g1787.t1